MTDATITVNNLGIFDIEGATPFLNLPESCMFCFGSIREMPWVDENKQVVVRPIVTLSGTNDHRVYDGGQLSQFITVVQEKMKEPEKYCH
jgi:2-oxoisovalerate dehydrogenase E2 component (dihydrolipoyl transacylase)